jgi:hypothetical protein
MSPAIQPCAALRARGRNPLAGARVAFCELHVERRRCDRDGILQRFLRFSGTTKLAERGSKPAIGERIIWA